ncbi:type 1 glutamine amidotransferase family protein [Streptomyces massasporeus]|uniref:hypothetical protein n=1 Tax=Streptomyces massasporeus TaxID=67324 RepID=UPI00369841D9
MTKILFVITASDHWTLADGTRQPAGFWAEEALGPYQVFKEAGYEIAAATPGGVPPTANALSLSPEFNSGEAGAERMRTALREATEPAQPLRIEDVNIDDYAAVCYPGGWGPMERQRALGGLPRDAPVHPTRRGRPHPPHRPEPGLGGSAGPGTAQGTELTPHHSAADDAQRAGPQAQGRKNPSPSQLQASVRASCDS